MEVYCIVRKVTTTLHVVVLIKYLKILSNYFLKISQPILRKSVNVPWGIEPKTSASVSHHLTTSAKFIFETLHLKHIYEVQSKSNLHKIPKNWRTVGGKWNQFYYKLHSKSYFSTYAPIRERHFSYRVINFEIPSAKKFLSSFAKYSHHPQDSFDLRGRNGTISSPHRTLLRHRILPLATDRWRWWIHHARWGNG